MFGNTEHEDIDMDQLYDDFIKKDERNRSYRCQ